MTDIAVAVPVLNETPDKGVAGTGGVTGDNPLARHLECALLAYVQRPLLAERDDDVANAAGHQGLRGDAGRIR